MAKKKSSGNPMRNKKMPNMNRMGMPKGMPPPDMAKKMGSKTMNGGKC